MRCRVGDRLRSCISANFVCWATNWRAPWPASREPKRQYAFLAWDPIEAQSGHRLDANVLPCFERRDQAVSKGYVGQIPRRDRTVTSEWLRRFLPTELQLLTNRCAFSHCEALPGRCGKGIGQSV